MTYSKATLKGRGDKCLLNSTHSEEGIYRISVCLSGLCYRFYSTHFTRILRNLKNLIRMLHKFSCFIELYASLRFSNGQYSSPLYFTNEDCTASILRVTSKSTLIISDSFICIWRCPLQENFVYFCEETTTSLDNSYTLFDHPSYKSMKYFTPSNVEAILPYFKQN